jgi:transcriptional regulator
VIFQGPQAYVSPGWYPGKAAHGRVVPTWDYLVAHVHGVARAVHEPAWLADLLDRLTHAQERLQPQPWRPQDAPADYLEAMTQAIVGIEVRIERVELKLKASQDEDLADRHGTVHGLQAQGGEAAAMAALVARALAAEGHGPA